MATWNRYLFDKMSGNMGATTVYLIVKLRGCYQHKLFIVDGTTEHLLLANQDWRNEINASVKAARDCIPY